MFKKLVSTISSSARTFSTSTKSPTAVVMLNMGGPTTTPEVGPFLMRLFTDGEIIDFGRLQNFVGPLLAKRRTSKIEKQYEVIGGSPIRKWTNTQGEQMTKLLDKLSPETAPHKHYIAFRYADPLSEETLLQMKEDGVTRAVAFSQYPQYSCTTAGSSFNHLWREHKRLGLEDSFKWSVIDRWPTQPNFIQAVKRRIELGLQDIPEHLREKTVIVFSAHSLPMAVVNKGDAYPAEVAATTREVMTAMNFSHPYILCWQSQVGPTAWLGPQTGDVLKGLGEQGHKAVLVVPIAFTSDHIETLFEIDIEYKEDAEKAGIEHFARAPALNDEPLLAQAQAEIVASHLKNNEVSTLQYKINCPTCTNPDCRSVLNPIAPYSNLRADNGRTPVRK